MFLSIQTPPILTWLVLTLCMVSHFYILVFIDPVWMKSESKNLKRVSLLSMILLPTFIVGLILLTGAYNIFTCLAFVVSLLAIITDRLYPQRRIPSRSNYEASVGILFILGLCAGLYTNSIVI